MTVIFSQEYTDLINQSDFKERFTPTEQEIVRTEKALKRNWIINKSMINQGGSCPIIHKKLNKYKRQYVGYINSSGEKIIWINFIWKREKGILSKLDKEIIIVLDGCSYFWDINLNLEKEELFNLRVNGSA